MGAPQYEQAGADIAGGGTTNTIPRWTGASTLGDSVITQSGTFVGVNQATPRSSMHVYGTSAAPVGTGSTEKAIFIVEGSSTNALKIGADSAAPFGLWLQGYDRVSNTSQYPIILNPIGGNVGIGTASPTAGRSLTTALDISIHANSVRVGSGAGGQVTNTCVGSAALASNTTGTVTVAVGAEALNAQSTGVGNTAVGYRALRAVVSANSNTAVGYLAAAEQTGATNTAVGQEALRGTAGSSSGTSNVAVGLQALYAATTGSANTCVGGSAGTAVTSGNYNTCAGFNSGYLLTTGSSNICIGTDSSPANGSNQLSIGSTARYVATNGGATTYYTTATAVSTGTLPATCGFLRVYLNGTWVKIPVYAD